MGQEQIRQNLIERKNKKYQISAKSNVEDLYMEFMCNMNVDCPQNFDSSLCFVERSHSRG